MNRNKKIGLLGTAILLSIVWGPGRPIVGELPHPANPKPHAFVRATVNMDLNMTAETLKGKDRTPAFARSVFS